MFFEVNITPKAKIPLVCNTPETRFSLLLAPFQPQTRINIETALNTSASCSLSLKNHSNRSLNVQVTKEPPAKRNVTLNLSKLKIEPEEDAELIITWIAREPGTFRDIIQLTDSRRIKYDIALTTSTISSKKNGGNTKVQHGTLPNKVHASNVSPKKRSEPKRILNLADNVMSPCKKQKPSYLSKYEGKENISTNQVTNWQTPKKSSSSILGSRYEKLLNASASKRHDFSMLIESDTFALTPPPWFRNDDKLNPEDSKFVTQSYTALLSPPNPRTHELRRETYTTAPVSKNITFTNEDGFEDSLSPRDPVTIQNPNFSTLINDLNFTSTNTANLTTENGNTDPQLPGSHLDLPMSEIKNNTFEVVKGTEVEEPFKFSDNGSLPLSQKHQLAPNRLSKNFATLSPVMPIEPRVSKYAMASSPICENNLDEEFIGNYRSRARFELSYSVSRQPEMGTTVQEVLEADLWAKPINQYSFTAGRGEPTSLEAIREETVKLTPATDKTYVKSFNKTQSSFSYSASNSSQRSEFSPPKSNNIKKTSPIRKISPKKFCKVSKEKSVQEIQGLKKRAAMNTSVKNGGKVSIPGVRITKLSLAGVARPKRSNRGSENEVSIKLHNPDDFFAILCNPDPFAATTTEDPFLASTLYYDDKWVANQEVEFKKWLNALLTPPEHLTSDVDTPMIDVAKIWQSCRLKEDVSLAETKEAVSARYHTNQRLNMLRRAACTMSRSNEVVTVLSRVTVCVEKGTLIIRKDRDLHKDIGLQKLVLELLLCYNPLWLRIGLEAIYGETIPLNSNSDILRLSKFLLNRLFSDPYIVRTHSHQTVLNLRLPSFLEVMNKFILKKFLFLVYFLDFAKTRKLIGHDPCLFHKQAAYKESRKILLKFAQELLSGVGDITRVLKPYGYVLIHKQTELDEYSYAVNSLSLDLRDGVRLCRVMELITGKRNLTSICRVPAISRLQKVYNVEVALKALTSSGYVICGNITGKCIADGHREKTLSLLWQIIYKFQAPHFNKAATTIQNWWQSKLWWVRVRNFLRQRKNNAACVIQRAWKSYRAKRELEILKEKRVRDLLVKTQAATLIQAKWRAVIRMQKDKRNLQILKSSVLAIQKSWRNYKATKPFVKDLKRKQDACRIIQQRWQATKTMRLQRSDYVIQRDAVIKIQTWWRLKLMQKTDRDYFLALKNAAEFVQSKWRANKMMEIQLKEYQKKVNAAKDIKKWWRREITYRKDRNNFLLRKDAVCLIESWWHRHSMRNKLLNAKSNAAIIIQRKWRAILIGQQQRKDFVVMKDTAVIIQRKWRANKTAGMVRQSYIAKKNSAIVIQRRFRAIKAAQKQREAFVTLKKAVLVIQKRRRANKLAKSVREMYLTKRTAAIVIQSFWRNWLIGFEQRCSYLSLKAAAVCIQDRFKANKAARKARKDFSRMKQSAIILQRQWRAKKMMLRTRKEFLDKKKSAIVIQRTYRTIITAREYKEKKRAIVKIQSWWKACKARKEAKNSYNLLKATTILIQRKYRARKVGAVVRGEYLNLNSSVIYVQQKWRAKKLMQPCRKEFLRKLRAVHKIQTWWKACLLEKETKLYYNKLKSMTIFIQRQYRAIKLGLCIKKEFEALKTCVIYIQRKWRAKKIMQPYRNDFLLKREAANKIRLWWKACMLSKETKSYYDLLKSTTIFMQRKYRAKILCASVKNEFETLKTAVIFIQRKWRAKKVRENYLTKRQAIIKIQIWWRSIIARKICQDRYTMQKMAAISIQRWYRSLVEEQIMRQQYNAYVNSIKVIQKWWKEILLRREKLRQRKASAATVIQAIWRGHKIRQTQSKEMTKLRERSEKAMMDAQPTETMAHRLKVAIIIVKEYENLGKLTQGVTALDTITHLLPQGCIALCEENLVVTLYDLLHRANRSRPWMDICLRASSILVSISKYSPTKIYVWREEYVETIIRLLSATIERETGVFLNLATLLWLLADCPARIQAIVASPLTVRSLSALHNKVSKKKTGLSSGLKVPPQSCVLPNPKPDWGLRHSRPRLFISVHHAVGSLCKRLKIQLTQ